MWWGFVATATNPGLTMAEVRDELAADPSIEIVREFPETGPFLEPPPDEDLTSFWAEQNGVIAHVHFGATAATLEVGVSYDPSDLATGPQRPQSKAYSQYVTDRLDAAFPELAEWERDEATHDHGSNLCISLVLLVNLAALGAWFAVRRARTRRHMPA